MKTFKKLSLLTICSLFAVLGCAKQDGSLSVNDASNAIGLSNIDKHPAFTDYEKLESLIGYDELLKKEDINSGVCFTNRSSLISYANQVDNKNHELDDFVDGLKDEDFENKKLIFTSQISLTAGNIGLSFNKMYLDGGNLYVALDLKSYGDSGAAVMRYEVYTFFINKDLSYNKVITVLNNLTDYPYQG